MYIKSESINGGEVVRVKPEKKNFLTKYFRICRSKLHTGNNNNNNVVNDVEKNLPVDTNVDVDIRVEVDADAITDASSEELEEAPKDKRILAKLLCLVTLTIQNAVYVQIFKYSRMHEKDKLFITSTAVCLAEGLKLILSCILMATHEKSWKSFFMFFYESMYKKPLDMLNVAIPAVCYVIMTNLTYISCSHLDVITFQIVAQLKIPATVIFSLILLRSHFRKLQYLSLALLMIGAGVVQVSDIEDHKAAREALGTKFLVPNKTLGFVTGLIACGLSGFAGVYFEKIVKGTNSSIWARNVQLSLLSILPAFIQSFSNDWSAIMNKGFFHGYNYIVWAVIVLHAMGGLIVALSMKLTNNVSKGYATSASIIVSGVSSSFIFHYKFSGQFAIGTALVVLSIPFYACTFNKSKIKEVKMDPEEGRQ